MSEENIHGIISREMAEVFALATTKFEQFYKDAQEKGSTAASSGYSSTAASSGDSSTAASSGYSSTAASSGDGAACSALGYRAAVRGDLGNLLMASEYMLRNGRYVPVGGKADLVDGKILKPGCWYIVEGGAWVEVDYTDGVFSRVLSTKGGVKKVKTDDGKVLFIVFDDQGNAAHGATIAEARKDLIYKVTAKFDGELPKSATGAEWVGLYRAVTGACAAGCRQFVESKNIDMEATYTLKQVLKLTDGAFNSEKLLAASKAAK